MSLQLRKLRILHAALFAGPWLTWGVLSFVKRDLETPLFDGGTGWPLLSTISLFVGTGAVLAYRTFLRLLLTDAARTPRPPDIGGLLQKTQLVGQAILESAALFGVVAWFLEDSPLGIVTLVLGSVAMLRLWPGEPRRRSLERMLEDTRNGLPS